MREVNEDLPQQLSNVNTKPLFKQLKLLEQIRNLIFRLLGCNRKPFIQKTTSYRQVQQVKPEK